MKVSSCFLFPFLFFCLELTVRKNAWMKATSVTVMVSFSKVPFWKFLDHSYSKFFLNNNKAHWQRDLRDILQLKIMRKWIRISANRSWINICAKHTVNKILSWLRMMKQKLTEKLQYSEVHCTKIEDDTSTYYCMLLSSQTNLVFKTNLVSVK